MLVAWKMQRRRLQEGVRASWRSREGKVAQKGLGTEGKNMWWREERKHTQHTRKKRKLANSNEMGCKEGCDGQKMSKTWWSPSLGPSPSLSTCGKGFLVSGVRGWARS